MRKRNNYAIGEVWYDHAGNQCVNRVDGSIHVQTINNDPSLTVQSEGDQLDLNVIVKRFMKTGVMSNIRTDQPMFGDFTNIKDYQTAVIALQDADEQFMTLPSQIRKRFENDPHKLLAFLQDEKNLQEAIALGLVDKPQAQKMPQGESTPSDATPKSEG